MNKHVERRKKVKKGGERGIGDGCEGRSRKKRMWQQPVKQAAGCRRSLHSGARARPSQSRRRRVSCVCMSRSADNRMKEKASDSKLKTLSAIIHSSIASASMSKPLVPTSRPLLTSRLVRLVGKSRGFAVAYPPES